MSNRVFEELERARMHQDITKYRDIVFQILLYKYLDEILLVNLLGNSLSDILEQTKDQADTSVLEDAFIEAEIIFQENIDEDFLNGIFDVSRLDRSFDKESIMSAIDTLQKASFDEIDIDELVENYTLASGKANGYGESCTPVSLCKLIAGLLSVDGTDFKTIGDQSCGIASLAIEIGKTANSKRLYLQETNIDSIRMAKIIYLLQGGNVDDFFIEQGNVIHCDPYHDLRFDVQVSMPPFGLSYNTDTVVNDDRYREYGDLPPKSSADMLYLENIIYHMDGEKSKAAMLCNMSPLNAQGTVLSIRKQIIEKNVIDAIIKIPGNVLFHTSIESYIILLKSKKQKNNIVFIDTTSFFEGRHKKEISEENIKKVCDIYSRRQEINDVCSVASLNEIENNNYRLGIEKYITKKKVQKLLKKESLVMLSSIVDIIKPNRIDGRAKSLNSEACKYPIDYEKLTECDRTSVAIKKGDIVFRNMMLKTMYLVDEEPTEEIVATDRDIVLRPHSIQSEYLYYLLKSEVGQLIIGIECPSIVGMTRITRDALNDISIPLPKKTEEEYRRIFEIENHLKINISSFNSLIAQKERFIDESVEDILSRELAGQVKRYKEEAMQEFLAEDIRELNLCYNSKAYKATLILAGSILEAVLIDWLSEIDGTDYFSQDYMVVDKRTGKNRRADLIDYIDAIADIERPNWVKEAQKAHEIRKKRNLVHAKLGIVSDEINDSTCKMVISYLKAVLKTRGIK